MESILSRYANSKLPNADSVANALNMSVRTLHRRLTEDGTSFQDLKDRFRENLARHYLSRQELSVDSVSAIMGFQDNSAFYRSFKKWTGLSPGQYRRNLVKGVHDDD